ncbi:meiotic recombination protein REC114 [Takifugu flavidus]|uniref:Meiotic recombination protein REC114 n=1 Tax=Takifugu flavidus TaxID=433684 RepID=A0A5C6NPA3_9TELE|nr:meiotic recombination protein REC114 [Takifugu flavidus]XP_056881459.1 meiotic recombination protein REC114 [Takifugu flavidus]TWW67467.1 Meiotic recombination protein REC114 [Takifugu flavidus]
MTTKNTWKLKRYGRFISDSDVKGSTSWKVYEKHEKKPELLITIVEAGYLLVLQGKECLDTIPLLCVADALKVHQKLDNLMFRFTLKGEGRMVRMQFDGRSRAEALQECSSAVEKLREYTTVSQDDALQAANQSPADASAPATQTRQKQEVRADPQAVQGKITMEQLTQHFLGETVVRLPEVYRHSYFTQGDLELILRICLLDPSFPAFVEKVETELRKLLEE